MKNLSIFWVILLGIVVLTGCGVQESKRPRDQIIVQLKWVHQAQFAGHYLADKKGFYARKNIDITLIPGGPKITHEKRVADLVTGKSHFAIVGGVELLKARSKGIPVVAIAVIFRKNPYVYVTLKNSGITTPQNFVGKKIMVPDDGKPQHDLLSRKLGLAETDIELIPYIRDLKPLTSGQIDAHMLYRTGFALAFEEQGIEVNYIWVDDYGLRLYADTIVTTEQIIQQNPKMVENFLRATLEGWRYTIENQDEAVDITLKYDATLTKSRQVRMMESQTPLVHIGESPIGWMEKSVWEGMLETLNIKPLSGEKIEIDNVFTLEFLNRIYGKSK